MPKRTSNITMRLLATVLALAVYGVTAAGTAFACPFITAAPAHEDTCSNCPKEESCPPEPCTLLCPYRVEKTAIVTHGHHVAFVPAEPSTGHWPALTRVLEGLPADTGTLGSCGLYLRNRVLLI